MTDTVITVTYERKFSDGNYGSEGLSLTWTGPYLNDEELTIGALYTRVAGTLRWQVLRQLARSQAFRVAQAAAYELEAKEQAPAAEPALEDLPW